MQMTLCAKLKELIHASQPNFNVRTSRDFTSNRLISKKNLGKQFKNIMNYKEPTDDSNHDIPFFFPFPFPFPF